jgi:hypothetical protein
VELVWLVGLVVAYYVAFPESLALNVFIFSTVGSILFSINPLIHGDGYWMLVDGFDLVNLRKRGIADLRERRVSLAAAYVVVSYSFGGAVFVFSASSLLYLFGPIGLAPLGVLVTLALVGQLRSADAVSSLVTRISS